MVVDQHKPFKGKRTPLELKAFIFGRTKTTSATHYFWYVLSVSNVQFSLVYSDQFMCTIVVVGANQPSVGDFVTQHSIIRG